MTSPITNHQSANDSTISQPLNHNHYLSLNLNHQLKQSHSPSTKHQASAPSVERQAPKYPGTEYRTGVASLSAWQHQQVSEPCTALPTS